MLSPALPFVHRTGLLSLPECIPRRSVHITCRRGMSIRNQCSTLTMKQSRHRMLNVFTEYLRAEGYYCTNRDKTDHQFKAPLTAWDANTDEDRTWYMNDSVPLDWDGRAKGQPFFTVINLHGTHEGEIRRARDKEPEKDPNSVTIPPYYPDTPVVRRDWVRYLDGIEKMDLQVDAILKRLERDGLSENSRCISLERSWARTTPWKTVDIRFRHSCPSYRTVAWSLRTGNCQ